MFSSTGKPLHFVQSPFLWPLPCCNVIIFECRGAQDSYSSTNSTPDSKPTYQNASERAKLLDALRHSQTRAREAEIAAKKAAGYFSVDEPLPSTADVIGRDLDDY